MARKSSTNKLAYADGRQYLPGRCLAIVSRRVESGPVAWQPVARSFLCTKASDGRA